MGERSKSNSEEKITMQVPSLDAPFAIFIDVHGVIFKRYKVHSAAGE